MLFRCKDLAFHCLPLALVDASFAKGQLRLLTTERPGSTALAFYKYMILYCIILYFTIHYATLYYSILYCITCVS